MIGFLHDTSCSCQCTANYTGNLCDDEVSCQLNAQGEVCANGNVEGTLAQDNCRCDCSGTNYTGNSCEQKINCTVVN